MSKNVLGLQESLDFIIERMATKSDIREIKKTLDKHSKILNKHTKILDEHTGQLNTLQSDMNTMRDKRLQLDVRTTALEKHLRVKPPVGTIN